MIDGWIKLLVDDGSLFIRVEDISTVRESQHYTTITTQDGETHQVQDEIEDVMREIVRIENVLMGSMTE